MGKKCRAANRNDFNFQYKNKTKNIHLFNQSISKHFHGNDVGNIMLLHFFSRTILSFSMCFVIHKI